MLTIRGRVTCQTCGTELLNAVADVHLLGERAVLLQLAHEAVLLVATLDHEAAREWTQLAIDTLMELERDTCILQATGGHSRHDDPTRETEHD